MPPGVPRSTALLEFLNLAPRTDCSRLAPLVLRCAADRCRAARVTVQLARRRSSCRTGLVSCRRFELSQLAAGADESQPAKKLLAPRDGFEPPTNGLTVRRSTTELPGNAGGADCREAGALSQEITNPRSPLRPLRHRHFQRPPDAAERVLQRLHAAREREPHMIRRAET